MTNHTPRQAGYRMPAEWAPHRRTWMMWPCRAEVWDDLSATRRDYAAVAHAIREFEPVTMATRPEDYAEARAMLDANIAVVKSDINDSWARDAGPCFVTHADGTRAGTRFRFNAWGGKYFPFDGDAAFSAVVCDAADVKGFTSNLIRSKAHV